MPYVPIIGDNEIQLGSEQDFDVVFGPHYEGLAAVFDGWSRATPRVYNPVIDDDSFFQNLSFHHRGVHFMGIDWCTRTIGAILGEQAELHDFPGGTWPWFVDDIERASPAMQESIVMASHHPMYPMVLGAFSEQEYAAIADLVQEHADTVYANFAGHFHNDVHHVMPAGFELFHRRHLGRREHRAPGRRAHRGDAFQVPPRARDRPVSRFTRSAAWNPSLLEVEADWHPHDREGVAGVDGTRCTRCPWYMMPLVEPMSTMKY